MNIFSSAILIPHNHIIQKHSALNQQSRLDSNKMAGQGFVYFAGYKPHNFLSEQVNTPEFRDLLLDSVSSESNMLGAGKDAFGYRVNGYPNLVLRIPRDLHPLSEDSLKNFQYTPKFPSEYNFGQTLYESDAGVELKEFVSGQGISIQDGPFRIFFKQPIKEAETLGNLNLLRTFANFPMRSYIDFAQKIKSLEPTDYVIDYFGSNNILVDVDKKEFNIIDLWEKGKWDCTGEAGFVNMASLLCDGFMNKENEESMMEFNRYDEYNGLMNEVIRKCRVASEIVGLPYGKEDFMTVINNTEQVYHLNLPERYNTFFDKYNI